MLYKKISLLIIVSIISISINQIKAQAVAKSIYAELFGPGFASINYDTRFTSKEAVIGGRIGFSGFSTGGNETIFFIPVGVNYLLGKDNRHYFEMGAGATLMTASQSIFIDNRSSSAFGFMQFGYRMQPKNGGFTFRANITPIFGRGFFIPYYFGISFGYKF